MKIDAVRKYALALPDTTEAPHHHFSSFRVRGKIFVTVPPDEKHIHVFIGDDGRDAALAMDPEFLDKLLWGGKVVGLRVTLAAAKAAVVKSLLRQAHEHRAPKAAVRPRRGPTLEA